MSPIPIRPLIAGTLVVSLISTGCFDFEGAYRDYSDAAAAACPPGGNLGSSFPTPSSQISAGMTTLSAQVSFRAPSGSIWLGSSTPVEADNLECEANLVLLREINDAPTTSCAYVTRGGVLTITVLAHAPNDATLYRTMHSLLCP